MFMELGSFIIRLLRLVVKVFMETNLGEFSFLTFLIATALMSIFLSNIIVKFSARDIHFKEERPIKQKETRGKVKDE